MLRALFIGIFFFTMTPMLISCTVAARQAQSARLGLHRIELLSRAVHFVAHPRSRDRRSGARPRGAVRFQSCVLGRHCRHRLDHADRLCRQARSRELAACRHHRENAAHGFRRPRTPSSDRRRSRRNRQAPGLWHVCRAVRRRHIERRQPRAAVPLGAARRDRRPRRRRKHLDPTDGGRPIPASTAFRWGASTVRWLPGMAISTSCRTSRRSSNGAPSMPWSATASPLPPTATIDRKAMSRRLEGTVRQLLVAALRGRPIACGVPALAACLCGRASKRS